MSDPSETSGRPSTPYTQQLESNTPSLLAHQRRRRISHSSDERIGGIKPTSSRCGPRTRKDSTLGSAHPPSFADNSIMQRSTSPSQMSPGGSVNYTRTGRISKAKKGLKVHHCDCGRVSTCSKLPARLETRCAWVCYTRYVTTPRTRIALSYTTPLPCRHVPFELSTSFPFFLLLGKTNH